MYIPSLGTLDCIYVECEHKGFLFVRVVSTPRPGRLSRRVGYGRLGFGS